MKKLLSLVILFLGLTVSACWYLLSFSTDYIASVNGISIITTNKMNNVSHYSITNNLVVDFPLTISVKLLSDTLVKLYNGNYTYIGNIIRSSLLYRILPNGNWITVVNYNSDMGSITSQIPDKTYFGKNNICPRNIPAGTPIMIRAYITDGYWQSGELMNNCTNLLTTVSTQFGNVTSLPYSFSYDISPEGLLNVDLGGAWYPHLCFTVIYSGKERPIR